MLSVILTLLPLLITSKTLPSGVVGFYCLLADDTVKGYTSNDTWTPQLYDFVINGSNVIWLTFINPTTMIVPPAFKTLAMCRGSGNAGCPTANQLIIASVGGEAYSQTGYKWPWLQSQTAAANMAAQVAQWPTLYGIDGIDLDIESPDGNNAAYAANIVYFAQQLRQLNSGFIITQPVYGYPQVDAENNMVNNGWDTNQNPTGLIDSIGIMYYSNTRSLSYVPNYADATNQNGDFPITVNVATDQIICGIQGGTADAVSMANDCVKESVQGMMVWYSSVYDATNKKDAFDYSKSNNAYGHSQYYDTWKQALQILTSNNNARKY